MATASISPAPVTNAQGQAPGWALTGGSAAIGQTGAAQNSTVARLAGGSSSSTNGGTTSTVSPQGGSSTPVKNYDLGYQNGKYSFTSQSPQGGTKTFNTLDAAKADIAANNAAGTFKINEPNKVVFGPDASKMYGSDMTERNKLAVEAISKSGQSMEDWLANQPGYTNASHEDQANTLAALKQTQSADVVGNAETMNEIQAVTQEKKEEAFAKDQQARQTQIDNLTMANNGIQRSEDLDKAQQSLDAIKQSVAYLGSQGMPGVSSVHLDAIGKQIDQAQTTYNNLVKVQQNQAAVEQLGVEYNAANFTKKITDLQYALSQQVGEATQNAINMLQINGNSIDTMDELQQVKGTMMQELDKSVVNIAISNQAQRQMIISKYDKVIADGETAAKNVNIVNKDLSGARNIYIDGNNKPMLDGNGNTIPYKADWVSSYDAATNELTTYDPNDPAGTITTKGVGGGGTSNTVQSYIDLKNAQGLTTTELMAMVPANLKTAVINALAHPSSNPSSQGGQGQGTATPVDSTTLATAVAQITHQSTPLTAKNLQCGAGVNAFNAQLGITDVHFTDPVNAKTAATNTTVAEGAKVGDTVVFDWSGKSWATQAEKDYGHVAIVTAVDANGNPTEVADWNADSKGNFAVHPVSANWKSAITGYFDPTKANSQGQENGGDVTSSLNNLNPQYGNDYQTLLNSNLLSAKTRNDIQTDPAKAVMVSNLAHGGTTMKNVIQGMGGAVPKEELALAASLINPKFARLGTLEDGIELNDTPDGHTANSINIVLDHLDQMQQDVNALRNGDVNAWNKLINNVNSELGDSKITRENSLANYIGPEIAKIITGKSNFSESEAKSASDTFNNKLSDKQLQGNIDTALQAMDARGKDIRSRADTNGGKDYNFINDDNMAIIQRNGWSNRFSKSLPGGTTSSETPDTSLPGVNAIRGKARTLVK